MWEYLAGNLKADVNIKLVSLRKLAPSHNVVCTGTSSIRMAWTLSLKYLSVKPRLLIKKGWFLEVESQLGKSFKVSVEKFIRRRTHPHNLWLLLVEQYLRSILGISDFCWSPYSRVSAPQVRTIPIPKRCWSQEATIYKANSALVYIIRSMLEALDTFSF